MKPVYRIEFFKRLQALDPHPKSDLIYNSHFELLAAVLLSAQATDKSVNIATAKLFKVASTPQAILKLGEAELIKHIQTIGLFRSKAKHLMLTCQQLVDLHGGEIPSDRDALEALPGVGRKTANVVLNIAFGQPTMAVDTHVFRVSNRTGLAIGKDPLIVEAKLLKAVPTDYMMYAHHWLILHGRYTCVARSPKCSECILRDLCAFKEKTPSMEEQAAPLLKLRAEKFKALTKQLTMTPTKPRPKLTATPALKQLTSKPKKNV